MTCAEADRLVIETAEAARRQDHAAWKAAFTESIRHRMNCQICQGLERLLWPDREVMVAEKIREEQ